MKVVRKWVSFQDRKNESTPKFPAPKYDIKQHSDLLKNNLSHF